MARKMCALVSLAVLVLLTSFAHADSLASWYITGTNDSGSLPCSPAAPCAKVTLDVNNAGTEATFTVTSLLKGFVFDTFAFNTGGATVNLVSGSAAGAAGSNSLGGSSSEGGWGNFEHTFATGKNGGSDGRNCSGSPSLSVGGCSFSFVLSSSSSLSLSTFEYASSGTNGSGFFAGHMASSDNSGYSGGPEFMPISEPGMLLILAPGLLTAAGLLTRRLFSQPR